MSGDVPENLRPRLCHVVKWPDFNGYGFNLHAEKGKAGQFIGQVDDGSPAQAAGLKEGDRIVEVNHVNIGNENHQQVVARIKSGGDETRLLVVDIETDNWYKDQKKVVKGDSPEVLSFSASRDEAPAPTPEPEPEPDAQAFQESVTVADNGDEAHPAEEEAAPVVTANGDVPANEDEFHRPRLCHLKIWPHFQGYGFNLHAERDKPGQFIGLVDEGSPAEAAGLRINDRIVEVNGVNVESQAHPEVIQRIKAVPNETRLLVVDRETDVYYKERGVTVHSDMSQVDTIVAEVGGSAVSANVEVTAAEPEAEVTAPTPAEDDQKEEEQNEEKKEEENEEEKEEENETKEEEKVEEAEPEVVAEVESEPVDAEPINGNGSAPAPEPEQEFAVAPTHTPAPTSAPAPAKTEGLELNLSVAEMKERLKQRKKQDPRATKMTFEQKYKDFERM